MAGLGKSTIAKYLFAKFFIEYDNVCFVDSSKEYSLYKLFSELLKEQVSPSKFDTMRRLCSKMVLIVLDGMDSLDSFESLCTEFGDQYRDSRLIITTRNRTLLDGKVERRYKFKRWKNPGSLKAFLLSTFKNEHPPERFHSLSNNAVKCAGGVSLALKVLASYLHTKEPEFCERTLKKLNKYPNDKIRNVFKESCTGLYDPQKNIFLYIVFSFKGKKEDHVIRILDACGFAETSGIKDLKDKALITISNRKTIQMHDLLQQTGLEIVRQACRADPGKSSRLKDNEAHEVIKANKGTDAIQGIALDLSQIKDLLLHADTFTKMKTLRFLKFHNTLGQSSSNTYLDLPATLEPFSDQLRNLTIYRKLSLRNAKSLKKFQMCLRHQDLKWVNLSGRESLRLHPSVLSSDTLVSLILDRCTKLERVEGEKHLKSLEKKISVKSCSSLEKFAVSSGLIENSNLSNTGIQTLNISIGRMHNLKWVNVEGLRLSRS